MGLQARIQPSHRRLHHAAGATDRRVRHHANIHRSGHAGDPVGPLVLDDGQILGVDAQHDLARRAHEFAEQVIRPVAADYDARQEFPWPVLEEAAQQGFYSPHSWWPRAVGGAAATIAMGLVFVMWWMILLGLVATLSAAAGLLFEYYRGEFVRE